MKHLDVQEIIDFVSFGEINAETMQLAKRVNGHIRVCKECREKVQAYQMVYDEMQKIAMGGGTETVSYKVIQEKTEKELTLTLER